MSDLQILSSLKISLEKEISQLKTPLASTEVAQVVSHIVKCLSSHVPDADLKFYTELAELANYIRKAKEDIKAIKPKEISTAHIPSATDELDAVVGATEEATNKIMDVCDEMTVIAADCTPEINERLISCTTKIFEACNFQDITGQRITKVVETLKHIDVKIEAIVHAMGEELHRDSGHKPLNVHAGDPEKGLLNGPQLPQNAASQDEIDKMMEDF